MKSTTQHTPGPWKVTPDRVLGGKHPYHDTRYITTQDCEIGGVISDGEWVATQGTLIATMRDTNKHRADAALIAAAPELLAALELINERLDRWKTGNVQPGREGLDSDFHALQTQVHDALAKAKGGAQ